MSPNNSAIGSKREFDLSRRDDKSLKRELEHKSRLKDIGDKYLKQSINSGKKNKDEL